MKTLKNLSKLSKELSKVGYYFTITENELNFTISVWDLTRNDMYGNSLLLFDYTTQRLTDEDLNRILSEI